MRIKLKDKDMVICLAGTFYQLSWGIRSLEKLNPHNLQIDKRIREFDAIFQQ